MPYVYKNLVALAYMYDKCQNFGNEAVKWTVKMRLLVCEKKRFAQKFTDGRTDGQTTDPAPKNECFLAWF